jgi:glycosyltransferase involved in cell wall biosynthesis
MRARRSRPAAATDADASRGLPQVGAPGFGATGELNYPDDEAIVEGDVLAVYGWCLFEGSRVARVEVMVDGQSIGLARPYVDRPDVAEVFSHPDAPVAGFELLTRVERSERPTESLVAVEATSLDGRRWCSRARSLRWVAPDPPAVERGELLRRRSVAALDRLPHAGSRLIVFAHGLSIGGGQLWLLELLRQIVASAALECTVVALSDGPLRDVLEGLGISVHITAPERVDDVDAYEGRVQELALLIRASGAGAVMVNTLGLFPAVDAAERAGVPSVWAIHESLDPAVFSHICWGPTGMHPYVRARFDACFQATRALVFVARQTAEIFARVAPSQKRFVVDYSASLSEIDAYRATLDRASLRSGLGFDKDSVVVAVVGVFEARKAQAVALAAFDELAVAHDRLRLVMVGSHDGRYGAAVREQMTRCTAGDRVQLVPITPDVYPWLAVADLFVCASDVESLPRSILEAMAFELPVVSTDAFGIAGLIKDGRTGWLTQPRDLEALVGVLDSALRLSPDERRGRALSTDAFSGGFWRPSLTIRQASWSPCSRTASPPASAGWGLPVPAPMPR